MELMTVIALSVPPLLLAASEFNYDVDLSTLRAKQLQKMLIKLGYDRSDVKKIIDRSELKRLVEELLAEQKGAAQAAAFQNQLKWGIMIVLGIASLYVIKEPVMAIGRGYIEWFRGFNYNLRLRCKLVSQCLENRSILGTLALVAVVILQLLQPLIQLSILMSWVIPYDSYFRRFLIPMPNFAITVNDLMGNRMRSSSKPRSAPKESGKFSIEQFGNYGMNVAPMVMMWIIRWLQNYLEEYGASKLIGVAEAKNERKFKRNLRRAERAKQNAASEGNVHYSGDTSDVGQYQEQDGAAGGGEEGVGQGANPFAGMKFPPMPSSSPYMDPLLKASALPKVDISRLDRVADIRFAGDGGASGGVSNNGSVQQENERAAFASSGSGNSNEADDGDFWLDEDN